eukprot:COSAG06_NODE_1352_length_9757_cov_3.878236_10_plen_67_part_00
MSDAARPSVFQRDVSSVAVLIGLAGQLALPAVYPFPTWQQRYSATNSTALARLPVRQHLSLSMHAD